MSSTKDNLNSRQFFKILDLISEGEIEGFATASKEGRTQGTDAYLNAARKDIFLNNTAILQSAADSTDPSSSDFNFKDIEEFGPSLEIKFGTANQTKAKGIQSTGNPVRLDTTVTKALPVNLDVSDPTQEQIRITLDFQALQQINSKGDFKGMTVELEINIRYNGQSEFTRVIKDKVKGRSADLYQRSYLVNFEGPRDDNGNLINENPEDNFPLTVQVKRLTSDTTNPKKQNAFKWSSYVLLTSKNLTYPNSAYTALKVDSKQFNSVPQRTFRIRGIKIRIPGVGTGTFSGTYSVSGQTVTFALTQASSDSNDQHGFLVGDSFNFTPASGLVSAGTYQVATVSDDGENLTFIDTSLATDASGGSLNCTLVPIPVVDNQTGRIVYPGNYIFNGTMNTTRVWCSCPAMILLDLMTNIRYGFGTHIAPDQSTDAKLYENIDLFSYFDASKFSNELVEIGSDPDVFEPRFSCNVSIQNSNEAYKLINELAGVMRCMPIWSAGSITLTQDRPKTPSYLFSLSNVTEAGFTYSGSDVKTRSTVINVSYLNMDTRNIDYETVGDNTDEDSNDFIQADKDRQDKYGVVVKNIKAFATTSATQARRLAKAILLTEENESETVSFTTSIDAGAIVRPGAVIEIQDPVRNAQRRGGRVKAATTTQITVDDVLSTNLQTITMADNPKLSVIMPDGTMETKSVNKINGSVFEVTEAFSEAPNPNTVWLYQDEGEDGIQAQLFRVISVSEDEGAVYTITALSYISNKYQVIEQEKEVERRTITQTTRPTDPPKNLNASERIVEINGKAVSKLILDRQEPTNTFTNPNTGESVQVAQGVREYQVNYRLDENNFTTVRVANNDFEIFNTSAGTYEIEIFSYNAAGILSSTSLNETIETQGKTAPPADITGLSVEPVDDKNIRLRWDLHPDVDVIHGGQIYVKHNTKTDGTGTFSNSTNLIKALAGSSTFATVPALEGEYILKARDDTGNFGTGETSIILDFPEEIKPLQVLTRREDLDNPLFQGTKSANVQFSSDLGAINLKSTGLFTDIPDFAAVTSLADLGDVASSGTYDFGGTAGGTALDLGAVYNIELKRHIESESFIPSDLFDLVQDVNLLDPFDGDQVFDSSADVLVRTSQNASTHSKSGTYAFSATNEILISDISLHNYKANNFIVCDFTSGNAVDGEYKITEIVSTSSVRIEYLNAPSGSGNVTCGADYTAFQPFANGRFKGQSFKFRATLASDDPRQDVKVTQLGYTASLPRRTEQSAVNLRTVVDPDSDPPNLTPAAKTIDFDNEFFTPTTALGGSDSLLPSIGITAENMQSGDYFVISNITAAGFTVTFKNSSDALIDRKFGFTAVGFGKKG